MLEPSGAVPLAGQPAGAQSERWAAWSFVLLCAALPWTIAPMSITTGLCVAASLLVWVRTPNRGWSHTPVDLPALGWALALLLSAIFALDRGASLARLPKALFPLLVPLAATRARDARTGRRALAVLMVSALLAAIFGLVWWLTHGAGFASRARGAVGHYMTFGGQLLLLLGLAGGLLIAAPGRWRLLAGATGLPAMAALAATYTRSAWIGLAVAIATLLLLLRPRLLPVVAIAAAAAFLLAPPSFRSRALSSLDPHDPTRLERTYMWRAGLAMFRDHPWTGVGLEDLKPVYERYKVPEAHEPAGHLHSVPVQIGATMGIVGLAAFLWLVIALFRAAAGTARPRHGLSAGVRAGVTAALAGFLVAGLFEWNFGDEELLYLLYVLIGIAWAARSWPAEPAPLRVAAAERFGATR